ncbi:MAG: type III-B CRISPR-associated protein Cas10/Cmr2, partial [Spirulina sp.]
FGRPAEGESREDLFKNRKNFNELVGKLTASFNKRRNGNDVANSERPSHRYPPMFETHPYLRRDEGDRYSAIALVKELPDEPWFSDTIARKRIVGQRTKREDSSGQGWYETSQFDWNPGELVSWVDKFEQFLQDSSHEDNYYKKCGKGKDTLKKRLKILQLFLTIKWLKLK